MDRNTAVGAPHDRWQRTHFTQDWTSPLLHATQEEEGKSKRSVGVQRDRDVPLLRVEPYTASALTSTYALLRPPRPRPSLPRFIPARCLLLTSATSATSTAPLASAAWLKIQRPKYESSPCWFRKSAVSLNLCSPEDEELSTVRRRPHRLAATG